MQHLTKNTYNSRIILEIQKLRQENKDSINKEIKQFVDKIFDMIAGILSSFLSGFIVYSLNLNTDETRYKVIQSVIFLILFLSIWYLLMCRVIPWFDEKKVLHKDINRTPEAIAVQEFNSVIVQKIAEIIENLSVIETTDDTECKKLNFIVSYYNLYAVVEYSYNELIIFKDRKIRTTEEDIDAANLNSYYNIYTVKEVIEISVIAAKRMENFLKYDTNIKEIPDIELLRQDLNYTKNKLNKLCDKFDIKTQ